MADLEIDDIQGIIVSGYGHLKHSRYLFLQIQDLIQAKAWLQQMVTVERKSDFMITSANWRGKKPDVAINLAFTLLGLEKMGLPADALQSFPEEFCEGMAALDRAKLLGDWGNNHPDNWEINYQTGTKDGHFKQPCHLLLILQAQTKDELEQLYQRITAVPSFSRGISELPLNNQEKSNYTKQTACEGYSSDQIGSETAAKLSSTGGQLSRAEHFGFHDNVSQPEIEGSPALIKKLVQQSFLQQDVIKAGEFVLGYLDENQEFPATPTVSAESDPYGYLQVAPKQSHRRDFGRNGSYLVFRKLSQNVAEFRKYLQAQCPNDFTAQNHVAAKLVGRWQSGAPLVLHPQADPDVRCNISADGISDQNTVDRNQSQQLWSSDKAYEPENRFSYQSLDSGGLRCPLGAHIRRVNPRDSLSQEPQVSSELVRRHRILRRGALYGDRLPDGCIEPDENDRGLLFLCINASIKRQFEFIQTMWINNPRFNGLTYEVDPLIGGNRQDPDSARHFTIQKQPVRQRLLDLPDFVTLRGGGYFFLPSISALRFLVHLQLKTVSDHSKAVEEINQESEYAPNVFNESY